MEYLLIPAAYLIGSIPFGLLITRAAGLGDVRKIGSGNIGATNVLRTGSIKLALLTLTLDAAKGLFATWGAYRIVLCMEFSNLIESERHIDSIFASYSQAGVITILAAMSVILGHVFPLWLKFKGGKGVATALGTLFVIAPINCLLFAILWLAVFLLTRISSLSALIAMFAVALVSYLALLHRAYRLSHTVLVQEDFFPFFLYYTTFLVLLFCYTHRENIRRLRHGAEHRFGENPAG